MIGMAGKDERGFVLQVEFLITIFIFIAVLFGAQDYWLVQVQMQQAEHVKNEYLNRVRVSGCLTATDYDAMAESLKEAGFNLVSCNAPTTPVTRDVSDPESSEVWLSFTVSFKQKPFLLSSLLGMDNANSFTPTFAGRELSEYVGS